MSAAPVLPTQAAPDLISVLTKHIFHLAKGDAPKKKNERQSKVVSDKQLFMILLILSQTLGKSRKPGSVPPRYVALTYAAIASRIGCTVRQVAAMIADAVKRGLIEVLEPAEAKELGLTGGHPQSKWFAARPDRWAAAEDCNVVPKLVLMPDPEPDADDEEEEPDTTTAEVVAVAPDQPLVILPGEKSRPVPWVSSAKKYAFDCSGVTRALSIQPVLGIGVLRFRITECIQPLTADSAIAKRRRNGEPPMKATSWVPPGESGDLAVLSEAVGRYCHAPDADAIPLLVTACRAVAPDCTPSEIAHFVDVKGPRAAKAETPVGFLVKTVPSCLTKEALKQFRRFHAAAAKQAHEANARAERSYATLILEAEADDPLITKEDRQWAKQILKG